MYCKAGSIQRLVCWAPQCTHIYIWSCWGLGHTRYSCLQKSGLLFVGILGIRALKFGAFIRAPHLGKLPYDRFALRLPGCDVSVQGLDVALPQHGWDLSVTATNRETGIIKKQQDSSTLVTSSLCIQHAGNPSSAGRLLKSPWH